MNYKLPPLPTFEEWCRIISPSEPGTQIASVENFVKSYAIAAIEAQGVPDGWREFVQRVAKQKPEKPDYWSACGQCERNISDAEDLIASAPPAPQAKPQPLSADRDARIAELEQRNRDLHEDVKRFKEHALSEKDARMALERELSEVRKDAERYRWLQQEHARHDPLCHLSWKKNNARNGAEWVNTAQLEAAIDAAMKGQQ